MNIYVYIYMHIYIYMYIYIYIYIYLFIFLKVLFGVTRWYHVRSSLAYRLLLEIRGERAGGGGSHPKQRRDKAMAKRRSENTKERIHSGGPYKIRLYTRNDLLFIHSFAYSQASNKRTMLIEHQTLKI